MLKKIAVAAALVMFAAAPLELDRGAHNGQSHYYTVAKNCAYTTDQAGASNWMLFCHAVPDNNVPTRLSICSPNGAVEYTSATYPTYYPNNISHSIAPYSRLGIYVESTTPYATSGYVYYSY